GGGAWAAAARVGGIGRGGTAAPVGSWSDGPAAGGSGGRPDLLAECVFESMRATYQPDRPMQAPPPNCGKNSSRRFFGANHSIPDSSCGGSLALVAPGGRQDGHKRMPPCQVGAWARRRTACQVDAWAR